MAQFLADITGINTKQALPPQTTTASLQGAAIDLGGLGEIATQAIVEIGAFVSTNQSTVFIQAEESTSSGGPWTAINNMSATLTLQASNTEVQIGPGLRTHRYARMNLLTNTGTTASILLSATFLVMPKSVYGGSGASNQPAGSP